MSIDEDRERLLQKKSLGMDTARLGSGLSVYPYAKHRMMTPKTGLFIAL